MVELRIVFWLQFRCMTLPGHPGGKRFSRRALGTVEEKL
jgi:hypothetical protein